MIQNLIYCLDCENILHQFADFDNNGDELKTSWLISGKRGRHF